MNAIKLITLFTILFGGTANAQITLSETMDMVNYRFADSQSRAYVDQHPSLTFNGFKSSNDNFGYSVESIINKIYYSSSPNDQKLIRNLFNDIVADAILSDVIDPSTSNNCPLDRDQVETNSRMLQNLAFVALISYVATEEGINVQNPPNGAAALPAPTQAMSNLKTAFTRMLGYGVFGMTCGDEVHRSQSITSTAKAIDLYLALENVYKHYENLSWNFSSSYFLNSSQKTQLMSIFKGSLDGMYAHLKDGALGVSVDEVEPGNRPLIIYTSIGYSSLVLQSQNKNVNGYIHINNLIEEALERSNRPAGNNRIYYWGYQTADGESFWAEGQYYFKYALKHVISLWHAKRINNISTNFTYIDPFLATNSKAKKPLIWLAQTYEPGGFSAPIDDGNKQPINTSSILRWASNYGNAEVGKRFSNLASEIRPSDEGIGLNSNMRVFELAVPRTLSKTAPSSTWGNTSSGTPSQNGTHEIVFRYIDNSGRDHFVYLNGEVGDAITRGEGHEQPDQLQLLYSVDEHSYLIDSGYNSADDNGRFINVITGNDYIRSTWNNYKDHNVSLAYSIQFLADEEDLLSDPPSNWLGGIEYPERAGLEPRVNSDHQSVSELYYSTNSSNNVVVAYGKVELNSYNHNSQNFEPFSDYRRRVLFIKDPDEPYLIDINMSNSNRIYPGFFLTTYHGNSNDLSKSLENTTDHAVWRNIDDSDDKHLLIQTDIVEGVLVHNSRQNYTYHNDNSQEKFDTPKDIKRLNVYGKFLSSETIYTYENTAVSFIKPIIGVSNSNLFSSQDYLNRFNKYFSQNQNQILNVQAYIKDINSSTKDVLVVRGAQRYTGENVSNVVIDIVGTELKLSQSHDFGFARLVKQSDGSWKSQTDYELNLEQVYPITTSISGPLSLSVGQYGTWTVAASSPPGAPGSFSYEWFLKSDDPAANGQWIGPLDYDESYTTRMYDFDNYLKLRVNVRRDVEFAQANYSVFCNDCGSGGGGMLSAQSSENDPSRQVKPHRTSRADTAVVLKRTGKVGTGSMQKTNPHFSLPEEFSLEQNYPNPFNPTTKLTFALPEESEVQVTIYNIMGQQVATLVQENLTAGFHEATFDAKNLSSGMYLARIRAIGNSGQVFTKELKMQLIK